MPLAWIPALAGIAKVRPYHSRAMSSEPSQATNLPASSGYFDCLKATKPEPPGIIPQPAGPQGTGTTFHSNLSPTLFCTAPTFHEPDMKNGTSPLKKMSLPLAYFLPATAGQTSGGIRPEACQSIIFWAKILKPSSTISLPSASKYLAP